jgi:hypothetical protein
MSAKRRVPKSKSTSLHAEHARTKRLAERHEQIEKERKAIGGPQELSFQLDSDRSIVIRRRPKWDEWAIQERCWTGRVIEIMRNGETTFFHDGASGSVDTEFINTSGSKFVQTDVGLSIVDGYLMVSNREANVVACGTTIVGVNLSICGKNLKVYGINNRVRGPGCEVFGFDNQTTVPIHEYMEDIVKQAQIFFPVEFASLEITK